MVIENVKIKGNSRRDFGIISLSRVNVIRIDIQQDISGSKSFVCDNVLRGGETFLQGLKLRESGLKCLVCNSMGNITKISWPTYWQSQIYDIDIASVQIDFGIHGIHGIKHKSVENDA